MIQRKADSRERYPFEVNVEEYIRTKIINRVQGRQIRLISSEIDSLVMQLKELGLLVFTEKEDEDGSIFRGITLTQDGERHLARLSIRKRSAQN